MLFDAVCSGLVFLACILAVALIAITAAVTVGVGTLSWQNAVIALLVGGLSSAALLALGCNCNVKWQCVNA